MIRRIRWTRRGLVALLVLGALAAYAPRPHAADGDTRLVLLVRHAEKARDDPRDPRLSKVGRRRAEALAAMLHPAGVTHLFSSEYRRTRETLAELARRSGIDVIVVPARDSSRLVAELHALPPGAVAVVAGHSNTVPELVGALGGSAHAMTDEQYDRLFMLVLPAHGAAPALFSVELHFGD